MWVFLRSGFFSVKAYDPQIGGEPVDEPHVIVRARVREDLEKLMNKYGLQGEIARHYADYPFHLTMPRRKPADVLKREADELDYTSFKDIPENEDRGSVYGEVWHVLQRFGDFVGGTAPR